jgi:hypothetical protein
MTAHGSPPKLATPLAVHSRTKVDVALGAFPARATSSTSAIVQNLKTMALRLLAPQPRPTFA